MPLPTIETPTYELKLYSSNKKVKYRPFLVKEEKVLIIALESKDQSAITNAVKEVLKKCILTKSSPRPPARPSTLRIYSAGTPGGGGRRRRG